MSRSVLMMFVLASAGVLAQQPASPRQTPSNPKLPPLFFSETWKQTGLERDVDKDVLAGSNLELKLYGATSKQIQIAPTTPNFASSGIRSVTRLRRLANLGIRQGPFRTTA